MAIIWWICSSFIRCYWSRSTLVDHEYSSFWSEALDKGHDGKYTVLSDEKDKKDKKLALIYIFSTRISFFTVSPFYTPICITTCTQQVKIYKFKSCLKGEYLALKYTFAILYVHCSPLKHHFKSKYNRDVHNRSNVLRVHEPYPFYHYGYRNLHSCFLIQYIKRFCQTTCYQLLHEKLFLHLA